MKFKFGLDSLMKYRKRLEQEAMRNYIEARNELDQALTKLDEFYQSIDKTVYDIGELCKEGGAQSGQIGMLNEYIAGQKIKVERQKVEIRMLNVNVEEKQALHLEAAKEFKVIEKLKERRYEQHIEEAKRKERVTVDDQNVMRSKRSAI